MKPEEQDIQVVVPTVEVSPTYSLFGPRRDMEYYLTPRSQFYSKNIARMVNSGYIPKKEIAGWKLDKTKYNPEYHGSREDFRKLKQDARHNKRELKKAMRYAGSDQQSAADREFYKKLGITLSAIEAGIPASFGAAAVLAGAAYTAPTWAPWVATNVALPMLGGAVVDDVTRRISDNYYNSFGDFVYRGSGLNQLSDGTWAETPVKFLADMSNPGYWAPYRKVAGYAMDGFKSLSSAYDNLPIQLKFTPRENFRYRNIGGKDGLNDLLESGVVRAKQEVEPRIIHRLNLNKSYKHPYFGGKGELVQTGGYEGKYFLGAEDIGNNFRRPKSTGGLVPINELTINDVTINRRIFPRMTNSPYIEWAPGKYTEYNTPLKILQKNGFLTPSTPDNGFKLYSGFPIKISMSDMEKGNPDWFYRLDFDGEGAFNNGADIKGGMLIPGKAKIPEQKPYLWFNLGKPYTTGINGKAFNRAFIFPKNKVQLLRVRDQKVPIGQWNGSSGFVLPTEYVSDSPIDLSVGAIYHLTDDGWRLYSGISKMPANNKSYQELVKDLRSEPFVINTNTVDDVLTFRRAVNSDDRFMAGVELKDRIGTSNKWNDYIGHGISKGPTEADNWANLRALLKYGIDKNRTFFQAPLQKASPGEIHGGFGTASGTPYYDGPFILVSPKSNPNNFTHVFINDSFENELGADLARRYKMMLQKEFPNIESLLYSEIK